MVLLDRGCIIDKVRIYYSNKEDIENTLVDTVSI